MKDKTMWKYFREFVKKHKKWMIAMALPDKVDPKAIDAL